MSPNLRILLAIALVIAICLIIRYRRFFELGPGVLFVIAISGLTGCGSELATAAQVANAAAATGEVARPILEEQCTAKLERITEQVEKERAKQKALAISREATSLAADLEALTRSKERTAQLLDRADKLVAVCDPLMLAFDSFRAAHIVLRAAIVTASATGDLAPLVPLVLELANAATQIAAGAEKLRGAK